MAENKRGGGSTTFSQTSISGRGHKQAEEDYSRKVYDNIHGFIYFGRTVWDFIDTPHFQRLRKIKQLSTQEFVTPGATHTRFEHSVGTAHLARKFVQTLINTHPHLYPPEDRERAVLVVTLAGLLHDVGHGPYSHAFDDEIVTEIQVPGQQKPRKWNHEFASELLFEYMTELPHIKGLLSKEQIKRVKALIQGRSDGVRPWEFELISNKANGIDVDKLDYFRRDAFYLGAKNIFVDHDLLMNEARIINGEICYPTKYVETVYNIFHSRYKLYKLYYFNVIVKATEMMVCDVLKLTHGYFRLREACEDLFHSPDRYIRLNDGIIDKVEDVYERILAGREGEEGDKFREGFKKAVDLLARLRERKLYKFVKELTYFVREKDHVQVVGIFQRLFRREKIMEKLHQLSGLTSEHICLTVSDVGFGLKEANPLKRVGFFRKEEGPLRHRLAEQEIEGLSMLYTDAYIERSIKIFVKDDSPELFQRADDAIEMFKKQYQEVLKFETGKGGKTPVKGATEQQSNIHAAEELQFLA